MEIVILDSNTLGEGLDLSIYKEFGDLKIYGFTRDEDVIERIKNSDIIITNKIKLNEHNLKYANNLKLICLTATGTNNIDLKYTIKKGIKVCNIVGYSTESVAQHTFALLFYLYEKLAYYDTYVKRGSYINDEKFTHYETKFHNLNGKTWGIIGLGNIGKRVAEIATVFGCNIKYYSTTGKNNNSIYKRVSLDELLMTSDIISIHAPLNDKTKNLITMSELTKMKKDSIILNLGRGGIINEKDLAKCLEKGIIKGAGIDVLEKEPMEENHPLMKIKDSTKLILTPHIGWASIESRQAMVKEVYLNIKAFLDGIDRCVVNLNE